MATAEQLEMARKIADRIAAECSAASVHRAMELAALAAIIETTELAAKWLDKDAQTSAIARSAAMSLRNFDHLKEPSHGE